MLSDLSEKLSFVFCYGSFFSLSSLNLSHELNLSFEKCTLTPQSLSATSASLVTSVHFVTLQPVPPGYVAPQEGVTPVTSYLTLSSTETITETSTETQTLATTSASAPAGAYTGLAPNGWNSSMSTFITFKSPGIGSVTITEKYHPGTAYPSAPSGIVPFTPGNVTRHIKARDVTDIVVATIDGVVVSWTNNYDQATFSSVSSPVQTGSSSLTAPVTTIGNSTSNVLPTPSATSTSLSSVAQLTTSNALSSLLDPNTSASSTVATATASSCANASPDFIIDFDDLPAFSAGSEVLSLRTLLF